MDTNGYSKGLIAGGVIVAGGLLGAGLGILFAPKSGKETRADIGHSVEGLLKKAKEQYEEKTKVIANLANRKKSLSIRGEKLVKMHELIEIAKQKGIPYRVGFSKEKMIHSIQIKEGNQPCFHQKSVCDEKRCLWMADCIPTCR